MRRLARVAALGGVALAVGACLPAPATGEAKAVTSLYEFFMAAAAVVAVIVIGLAVFAIVRYRRRDGDGDELPEQVHGNIRYEVVWTGLPILTIIVLFAVTFVVIERLNRDVNTTGTGVDIDVTAFRWGWRFEYPADGIRVEGIGLPGPEVVVPVGEPVRLTLRGEDVVHSFFVPQFLFKRDVIPGRENRVAFTVDEAGTYRGQCAEFCGVYHSRMPFTVRAVDRATFDAWVAAREAASPSAQPEASSP